MRREGWGERDGKEEEQSEVIGTLRLPSPAQRPQAIGLAKVS